MAFSSTGERASKLRRLQNLRQTVPHVTKAALAAILDNVKQHGVPELASAKHMREGNRLVVDQACAYGPLHEQRQFQCLDGSKASIGILNLFSFLHFAFKAGGSLYETMKNWDGPLGVIIYTDELVVGNPLAHSPRKLWAVYLTFQQYGQQLQNENAWVTMCLVRSSIVQKLDGNLSSLMREILLAVFNHPLCEVLQHGVLLQKPPSSPGSVKFRMKLAYVIQDGGAHKFFWSIKGDAGSRYCIKCSNVIAGLGEEEVDPVSAFTKVSDLKLSSSSELLASWDRMEARARSCSQAEFKMWQQATGISWNPFSVVACKELRQVLQPQEQYVHDWMHCLLSNGLLGIALVVFEAANLWATFPGYLSLWSLPSQWGGFNLTSLFDNKAIERHKKSGKFVSTASELLSLLPIISHFLSKVCKDQCKVEAQAFMCLAHLVELLQSTWTGLVHWQMMQECAEEALAHWKACSWPMIKKNHWLLHFGQAFRDHGQSLSCFTQERKHKMISRYCRPMQNTQFLEKGLFEEVVNHELSALYESRTFDQDLGLVNAKPLPKKLYQLVSQMWSGNLAGEEVLTAQAAKYQNHLWHGTCSKQDVVLAMTAQGLKCGQVQVFLGIKESNEAFAIVKVFTLGHDGQTFATWKEDGDHLLAIPIGNLLASLTFAKDAKGITTLIPWCCRDGKLDCLCTMVGNMKLSAMANHHIMC
eukprot:Skav213458  [mRNA]  locus=scaffold837:805945:808133:- [translate_table: standard]